jgi:hypothetical protein
MGCVRLHLSHAAALLFASVERPRPRNTRIETANWREARLAGAKRGIGNAGEVRG